MAEQRLNQVLAVEKSTKAALERAVTEAYQTLQKPALFEGHTRTYEPFKEDDDKLPREHQIVQQTVPRLLGKIRDAMVEQIDIIATKDASNCSAQADIVVGGQVIAAAVPAVTLLALERQLTNLRLTVAAAPVLDAAEEWDWDEPAGLYKTEPKRTVRTKKTTRPITLAPATEKHAAQAQLITEDISAGYWAAQRFSGAISAPKKEAMLARLDGLLKAVKHAREHANMEPAPDAHIGAALFSYLLSGW